MFEDLRNEMLSQNIEFVGHVESAWMEDYKDRYAISEFLTDKLLGLKRLISMPDRITSCVHDADGEIIHRPSVTNEYLGSMDTIECWWESWKNFMFGTSVKVVTAASQKDVTPKLIYQLIDPILRSKYPAVTVHEQMISTPLQILCLALYDAVLWWIMNTVAKDSWQMIKHSLCCALIKNKFENTVKIIKESYSSSDVIFLQESAAAFVSVLRREIQDLFLVIQPRLLDGKRDQNSLILARRARFIGSTVTEITDEALNNLGGDWVAAGDLLAITIEGRCGNRFILASFHGDSNGLATQPLVVALNALAEEDYSGHVLVCGLDANTDSKASFEGVSSRGVQGFNDFIRSCGMVSCWGATPDPGLFTTCNSRTSLQPQLHKAVRMAERVSKAQRSLKDWIVAFDSQVAADGTARDNTGRRSFVADVVFPTLHFPSDHAIISTQLRFKLPRPSPGPCSDPSSAITAPSPNTPAASDSLDAARWEECDRASSAKGRQRRGRGSLTLYDYWNITDLVTKPSQPSGLPPGAGESQHGMGEPSDCGAGDVFRHQGADAMEEFLVEHFRGLRGGLGCLRATYAEMMRGTDRPIWVLFSPRPVSAAFPQPLYLGLYALVMVLFLAFNASTAFVSDEVEALHFRVTPLQSNSSAPPILSSAQILLDGCRLPGLSANLTAAGPSLIISYPEPVCGNGVALTLAAPTADAPAVLRFDLETSWDGVEWASVGLPEWLDREADYRTAGQAVGPNGRVELDLSEPWPWRLYTVASLGYDIVVYLAILAGLYNQGRLATCILAAAYLALGLLSLAAAAGCDGPYGRFGLRAAQDGWLDVVFAAGVFTEAFLIELIVLGNAALLLFRIYYAAVPAAGGGQSAMAEGLVMLGFALSSTLGGALWLLRRRAWAWVRRQVEAKTFLI